MTKMLQKKFVVTAMVAISVLLLVLLGAINVANYWMNERQIGHTLSMLSSGEGEAPPKPNGQERERPGLFSPPMDADMLLSSRFFLVFLNDTGSVDRTDVSKIASVTEKEAWQYGEQVSHSGTETGRIGRFCYKLSSARNGEGKIIVFLDIASQVRSFFLVLLVSVSIGVLCWLLMLLLVILLSKRAILPIARSIEKQKQFVTNAGHEIKTPLAIILANTDALELRNGESKYSRNIREQTVRLNGLMQNLLSLARLDERREYPLPKSEISLTDLLEKALSPYRESAALKGIDLQQKLQPQLSIRAHEESLVQLCSILFDNAFKYTNEGGIIWVTLEKRERRTVIEVKNTCDTLPDVQPEKLFDRFYRADQARTQKNGGYGIGLSVAQSIVSACGGTIFASYEAENIIAFTVTL